MPVPFLNRLLVGLAVMCLVAALSDVASVAPLPSYASTMTKRCHTTVKKVHGRRTTVRVCRRPAPLFHGPSDLVVDQQGHVLVADQLSHRIEVLSMKGKLLARWSSAGARPSTFKKLYGIALDQAGNVYLSDGVAHILDKLDAAGHPVAQWSTNVAEDDSFPTLLAVSAGGDIYVSDHAARAVLHLSSSGAFEGEIGKGDLGDPYGVAIGPDGNLYIADFGAGRVREYTPGGQLLAVWGDGANGSVSLQNPEAIAVDGSENVFVTEQAGQVLKFSPAGKLLAAWSGRPSAPLDDPSGIALDGAGNIYVAEYMGNRVDKLSASGHVLASWK